MGCILCTNKIKYTKITDSSKVKTLGINEYFIFYLEIIETENLKYYYFIIYDKAKHHRVLKLLLCNNVKPKIIKYNYDENNNILSILFQITNKTLDKQVTVTKELSYKIKIINYKKYKVIDYQQFLDVY